MSELAMVGPPSLGEETLYPWNASQASRGSSSRSATAVAAVLCAGSIGSDTGGSIRFPAANNNLIGLMPTYGRVSQNDVTPLSWTLDHLDLMTQTVEDAAIMLNAISGFDPADKTTSTKSVGAFRSDLSADLRGLEIGVLKNSLIDIDFEIGDAIESSIRAFESLGAKVRHVRMPNYRVLHIANSIIYLVEAFNTFGTLPRQKPSELGKIFSIYGYMGGLFYADEYVQAMPLRSRTQVEVEKIFEKVDLILSPTTNSLPKRIEEFDPFVLTGSTRSASAEAFNLAAYPALSVPCGFIKAQLPIRFQVAAKPMDEQVLLNAVNAYQELVGLHHRHPAQ